MAWAERVHRVLLVQRVLPPYRLPFFRKLANSPIVDLTLAYGDAAKGTALRSILNPQGIETLHLSNSYLAIGGREFIVCQHGLLRHLASCRYDVVIAEFNPRIVSNLGACALAAWRNIPFIWWGHGFSPRSSQLAILVRLFLIRKAQALVLYDAGRMSQLMSSGIAPEKLFVAPNSMNIEEITKLARKRPLGKRKYILYIGRLRPAKKVHLLLRAYALARPELPPDSKLVIIGDGPEKVPLIRLSAELGIQERVEFTGAMYDQSDLACWFNSCWVSVSPGCIGLSAVHSLAYGVPILVAEDEAHGPEFTLLMDGVNARFFPSDDVVALSEGLVELRHSPQEWALMSRDSVETVYEKYGIQKMVSAFVKAIEFATSSVEAAIS